MAEASCAHWTFGMADWLRPAGGTYLRFALICMLMAVTSMAGAARPVHRVVTGNTGKVHLSPEPKILFFFFAKSHSFGCRQWDSLLMENFNELGRESTALSRWIQGNNNNNMKISETMNVRRSNQLMLCVTRVQPKRKSTYKFQMIKYVEFISLSLFFF